MPAPATYRGDLDGPLGTNQWMEVGSPSLLVSVSVCAILLF